MKNFLPKSLLLSIPLAATMTISAQDYQLNRLSGFATGVFDEGAAEIVDYSSSEEKLYFVNANDGKVGIVDISNLSTPVFEQYIDIVSYTTAGGGINAVAVGDDFFAVAVENDNKQANGYIAFFDLSGNHIVTVDAGALPDNIQVSPDGNYVVSANEGEPSDDYLTDPEGSVTIVDISGGVNNVTNGDVTTVSFTSLNGQNFTDGTRIFGPNATVAQDLEPEYVAFNSASTEAYIICQENNCVITIDLSNNTISSIKGLGFKDHSIEGNGFDASNESIGIHINTHPVKGMYQPDASVTYNIGGVDYLFTANEGDSRDYDGYSEEARVADFTLDASAFPNAAVLQNDTVLGRLKTTVYPGDADNNGEYEEIYSYGARSFSIWNTSDMSQVYDSGDEFETVLAEEDPIHFNSTNDDNDSFKDRSDDKGCEPEAIAVGTIGNEHYAFIGLERMGGIMMYEVTDPSMPEFLTYENNRNFDVDATSADAGDLAPECLKFISSLKHTAGIDLLVSSNEVSGTISIFEVVTPQTVGVKDLDVNSLSVYPNPVNTDVLRVSQIGDYMIVDIAGKIQGTYTNVSSINVNHLSNGMYLLVSTETNSRVSFVVAK